MAMSNPKLLYSLVASRGQVVLAEASSVSGNVPLIALRILEKLPTSSGDLTTTRVSYTQERHMFHILVADGLTYLVVAEESFGRRIPYAFLEDIKMRFTSTYGASALEAVAYEYNTEFSAVLAERARFYASDAAADTINRVKGELQEVKGIMIENIEKVLERGEKLDLLVDKTEGLQQVSLDFRRNARTLQRAMWWKNVRLQALVVALLVLGVYFVVAMACGFTFSKCK